MARRLLLLVLAAAWSWALAVDYPQAEPGRRLAFPRDYGSHPTFRQEWWYVTGWLKGDDGRDYGFQVSFFRHRPGLAEENPSAFAPRQLLFAHATLTDVAAGRLRQDQRAARAGLGLAGAEEADTHVWIGDWRLSREGANYRTRIQGNDFALALDFRPTQVPLLQGQGGFSRKGPKPGQASHYYSLPQLAVQGEVILGGRPRKVEGSAWLDHEWSSRILASEAVGWDWAGINLADGGSVMAFRLRDRQGSTLWTGGSYRGPQGEARIFQPGEVVFEPRRRWRSPRSGAEYPVAMEIRLPCLSLVLEPLIDPQEVDARRSTRTIYWEGAVKAFREGREVGRGYLELTGYWKALDL